MIDDDNDLIKMRYNNDATDGDLNSSGKFQNQHYNQSDSSKIHIKSKVNNADAENSLE